jgi:serine protease Do
MSTRSLNWLKLTAVVAPAFVLGLFFAGLLDFPRQGNAQERAAHTPIIKVDAPRIPAARPLVDLSDAYAAVAEAVRPSVVYIVSQRPVEAQQQPQMQIFGQLPPGFQMPRQGTPRRGQDAKPEIETGSGSGFIVSSDGYILTNNHVIEGSSKVTVRLLNGREYNAKIVGTDKDTDVGVLKIDATGLTPAALGSSDAARVGEWVLAIGNPLGEDLTFTVTQGIVSAKGRAQLNLGDNSDRMEIRDYIQTDAVINRGNSGGPLVNARGEVIGINAAIASTTGYFTGYAFAVPIDLARKVMDQIVTSGHVERAGMQITVKDASRADAEYLGLATVGGVLVSDFSSPDSPAKRAGIEKGDVIVAIDGIPMNYTSQLQQTVGFRHPGESVKVDVLRKDGKHSFTVKLVSLDAPTTVADAASPSGAANGDVSSTTKAVLGIVTEPLTAATATEIGLPATTKGLLVRSVAEDSPAASIAICSSEDGAAGACVPDVIVSVEGKPVRTAEDLKAALGSAVHGVVTLEIATGTKDHKGTTRIERVQLH